MIFLSLSLSLSGEEGGGGRVCLVGLHSCGDLTPYILRMVSGQMNSDLCAAAVVVGCCYHKMSLTGKQFSFPPPKNLCRRNCF